MEEIEPDLSLCLVVQHPLDVVREHLHSLHDTSGPIDIETLAVSLKGNPAALVLAEEFPDTTVFTAETPKTMAAGRNLLAARAKGRYLAFMDSDVVLRSGCLQEMVHFMDENPEAGLVGPQMVNGFGLIEPSASLFYPGVSMALQHCGLSRLFKESPRGRKRLPAEEAREEALEVAWLAGSAILVRREAAAEIGEFDGALSGLYAELDYCRRAVRAGWHIFYLRQAEAMHHAPARYRPDASPALLSRLVYLLKWMKW